MKLVFNQTDLMNSVNIVMKAIPGKTTMPILQCIMIDASRSRILFTGNDMELGIETEVKGTIIESGKIALDAKILSDIVRKLPNNEVTIVTDDKYTATITCEKAKFVIPGKSGEDFAYLPTIETRASVAISQFSLKELIRQTIFSIAVNENNKLMTGELFEIKNNVLLKVVVPGKTLSEISKIISGEGSEMVTINFSSNYILFEFDQTVVLSRLIEGEYFQIDQMLSSDYDTKIEINRQEFISCIDRATLLVRESDKMPVIMDIEDTGMNIQITTPLGSMNESMGVIKTGKDIVIGFNPRLLLDALRVIDDESVTLYFVNAKAPCFIRDDKNTYIYLILPVNISR